MTVLIEAIRNPSYSPFSECYGKAETNVLSQRCAAEIYTGSRIHESIQEPFLLLLIMRPAVMIIMDGLDSFMCCQSSVSLSDKCSFIDKDQSYYETGFLFYIWG